MKEKGEKVWEQILFEEGASYIAVHFSKIEIAQEDYLVVRDPANTRSWKYSYEEIQRKGNRFWSIHIYGEEIVVEIYSAGHKGAFGYEIDKIAKGFNTDALQLSTRAICGNDDSFLVIQVTQKALLRFSL